MLSISSIFKVLALPAKTKMSYIKIANKQDQFKQNKREKEHGQRFILAYFKLLIAEKLAISLRRQ